MAPETTEVLFARYGPRYRIWVTVVSLLGSIAAILTTTSVNVALPDIMGTFGIGQDRVQWMSTGNLAGVTVGMLMNAWLVESFGQRKIFVGGLLVFVASLLVAAFSPDETVLILARVVQGVITGIMQTLAMSTLFSVFPPDKRGLAMGFFSINVILGPAIGPVLGGLMIEHLNWRYVFYMAIPFSAIGILFGSLLMPERERTGPRARFDWLGFILLCIAMGTMLTGLSEGHREGWAANYVVGLMVVAALSMTAFVFWELHASAPLVKLRMLANREFAAATLVSTVFGFGMFGTTYLVPLFVQSIQKFSAIDAGLLLTPGSLILALTMPVAGYMADRMSARLLVMTGLIFFGLSTALLVMVDAHTGFWYLALVMALGRGAQSLINPPLNLTALRALPPADIRQGSGMINFSRQLGGAFGVNLLSLLLDYRTAVYGNTLAATQSNIVGATGDLLRSIERQLAVAGASPALQAQGALHYLGRVMHEQAYSLAFRDTFLAVTIVFVISLVPAMLIERKRRIWR